MVSNYKEKLAHIKAFFFDVDGVFTDNIVYLMSDGEQARTANVRDGYAVQLAVKKGIRIVILSGGKSEAVRKRFEGLGVRDIFLGASDKVSVFRQYLLEHNLSWDDICYMGDDIPDYRIMKDVGLSCCPADAVPEIKSVSSYISPLAGGRGCVRDLLEQAMKVRGLWMDEDGHHW